jgi:hypothetical protein
LPEVPHLKPRVFFFSASNSSCEIAPSFNSEESFAISSAMDGCAPLVLFEATDFRFSIILDVQVFYS